jgi:hypothetical protein
MEQIGVVVAQYKNEQSLTSETDEAQGQGNPSVLHETLGETPVREHDITDQEKDGEVKETLVGLQAKENLVELLNKYI